MKSLELQSSMVRYLTEHSRYLEHRPYIGLSSIADCDRVLYHKYVSGNPGSVSEKLRCFVGYAMQDILTNVLGDLGTLEFIPPQTISLYDGLIQGHTDGAVRGETTDLIEIKSLASAEWIPDYRNVPQRHFWQVQAYMHYLEYEYGHIIYYARDSGDLRVIGVHRSPGFGKKIDERVDILADAIIRQKAPPCSCGRCTKVQP